MSCFVINILFILYKLICLQVTKVDSSPWLHSSQLVMHWWSSFVNETERRRVIEAVFSFFKICWNLISKIRWLWRPTGGLQRHTDFSFCFTGKIPGTAFLRNAPLPAVRCDHTHIQFEKKHCPGYQHFLRLLSSLNLNKCEVSLISTNTTSLWRQCAIFAESVHYFRMQCKMHVIQCVCEDSQS